MKKNLRTLGTAALSALATLSLAACYYDPSGYGYYPSGPAVGSVFVATASSDWGYDPYRYCYYSYGRRAYYDPWLHGYYPVGYYPPPVVGCPHPYGWRPGHGVCPPPGRVHDRWIDRYQDRLAQIKASNYAWASNVRYQRQNAIAAQQDRNQAIRAAQGNWADRTRANRQSAPAVQQGRNQTIQGSQQNWADKTRAKRQFQPAPQAVQPQPPPAYRPGTLPSKKGSAMPVPNREPRLVPPKNEEEDKQNAPRGPGRGKTGAAPWLLPANTQAAVKPPARDTTGRAWTGGTRYGSPTKATAGGRGLAPGPTRVAPPPRTLAAPSAPPAPLAQRQNPGHGKRSDDPRFSGR